MKNILNTRLIAALLISLFSVIVILISTRYIETDNSIASLLPGNKELMRDARLVSRAPISDKVILFVNGSPDLRKRAFNDIENMASDKGLNFRNMLPGKNEVKIIYSYLQNNSLLLYPYELLDDPFQPEFIKKRLAVKESLLDMNPFMMIDDAFINDPILTTGDILKLIKESGYKLGGGSIESEDGESEMRIYSTGIFPEEYDKSRVIFELNKHIEKYAKDNGFKAFLISSHLFYYDSYSNIRKDVTLIFILSIIFTLLIFIYFFKDLSSVVFGLMPIAVGFAAAFLTIAIFKKNIGGIALAFGATTTGISVDYSIHYLIKRSCFNSLKQLRSSIGLSMIMGLITTLISFVLLPFSGIRTLQDISIFSAVMVTFSFLAAWFLLQPLYPPVNIIAEKSSLRTKEETFLNNIVKIFSQPSSLKYAIGWTLFVLILGVGIFLSQLEDDVTGLDKKHHSITRNIDFMHRYFKETTETLFLCFSGNTVDEVKSKSLEALVSLKDSGLGFLTPALFIPENETLNRRREIIKQQYRDDLFKEALDNTLFDPEIFSPWRKSALSIDNISLEETPDYIKTMTGNYIIEDNNTFYMLIPIQHRDRLNELKQQLSEAQFNDFFIIDFLNNAKNGLVRFELIALTLLISAIIIVFIVLSLTFRSIKRALFSVIPALAGIITVIGLSGFLGFKINLMHIAGLIIITGAGVDYGIFLTGAIIEGDMNNAALTVRAILTCALTTIAGFGVLIISSNTALFSLGFTTIIGIATSLITTVVMIPPFLGTASEKN